MENPDRAEPSTTRTVSPPNNGKRDHEEDQDKNDRNTRRRTGAERTVEPVNEVEAVERIVLDELCNADVETAWKSMEKLWKLLNVCDDELKQKQQAFYHVGGHAFVVKVMNDHQNHQKVQYHGICVIAVATCANECLRSAIGKVRGIQAIISAMKKFPAAEGIISLGFTSLWNLICASDASQEYSDLLGTESGDLPFLVERMKSFPQDAKVVGPFCCFLYNLSMSTELKNAIIDAGAITALGLALESHKNNESIQEHARKVIIKLLTQD